MTNKSDIKPGQSCNMYRAPAHYVAERRNPTTGATYFVPVCSTTGQSWGTRHATREEAATAILESGGRVIEVSVGTLAANINGGL